MELFGIIIMVGYSIAIVTALVSLYKGSIAEKSQGIKPSHLNT